MHQLLFCLFLMQSVEPKPPPAIHVGSFDGDVADLEDDVTADATALRYWVVQFADALTPAERTALQAPESRDRLPFQLSESLGEHAYLEYLRQEDLAQLSSSADGKFPIFRPYIDPRLKLSPELSALKASLSTSTAASHGLLKVRVSFLEEYVRGNFNAAVEPVLGRATALGSSVVGPTEPCNGGGPAERQLLIPAEAVPGVLAALTSARVVRHVERIAELVEHEGGSRSTSGAGTPEVQTFRHQGLTGGRQVVNVIEEYPLSLGHCWFRDPGGTLPGSGHRKVAGTYPDYLEYRKVQPSLHATAVAGVVAGSADGKTESDNSAAAVAWAARLFSSSMGAPANLRCSLEEASAAAEPAWIHTASWHVNSSYDNVARTVDEFTWLHEDNLVVASAGNAQGMGPPGTAKNALTVGAAKVTGGGYAHGQGYGKGADDRRKPDLCAPGCSVRSANGSKCALPTFAGCSTSLAAAATAGAAALVRQYYTEGWYPTGDTKTGTKLNSPSGALLKATLINATRDMGKPGPDIPTGWGALDLDDTLYFPGGSRKLRVFDVRHAEGVQQFDANAGPGTPGAPQVHDFTVGDSEEPVRVTLVWTDAPPAEGRSTDVLVNDLDLEVVDPNGQPYSAQDSVNTVEQVDCEPVAGKWTATVRGTRVEKAPSPGQGQGYALVVTFGGDPLDLKKIKAQPPPGPGPAPTYAPQAAQSRDGRHRFDLDLAAGVGHDTNAVPSPAAGNADTFWRTSVVADYRFTRFRLGKGTAPRFSRAYEVGLALAGSADGRESGSTASRDGYRLRLYLDRPLVPGSRHSWGVLARHSTEDDHRTTIEPAVSLVWGGGKGTCECEPNRAVLYASTGRGDTSGGDHAAVGAQFSFLRGGTEDPQDKRCRERGVFRKLYLDDHRNFHAGYEHRRESFDGTASDRDLDVLWFDGQVPVNRPKNIVPSGRQWRYRTFDWHALFEDTRHRDSSTASLPRRHDQRTVLGAGVMLPLGPMRQSQEGRPFQIVDVALRLGAEQTWLDSNIANEDYSTTVYSLTFRAKLGRIGRAGLYDIIDDIPNSGSTLDPEGGSGPGAGRP